MRSVVAVVLLFFCLSASVFAQKVRYGQELPKAKAGVDYPIRIHVSGIHLRPYCKNAGGDDAWCSDVIYTDAAMNGQKIELMGNQVWLPFAPVALVPGDYQARLLKPGHREGANPIGEKYELLLPDRTIWRCTVTGISE
jgi:hypothetical protein